MASITTISGVATGIDWKETVDALMQIEQRKVTLLENRRSTQNNRLGAWRTLNTRMLSLKTSMDALEESSTFLKNSASVGDAAVLAATAGSKAQPGVHGVLVDQLAAGARLVHQGWADANSTAVNSSGADQVFAYTFGSGAEAVTRSLTVTDGATLQDLRDLINEDPDNPGVRATLLDDGSAGATAWHLVLTGTQTGADAQLAIDDTLTTLGDGSSFDSTSLAENRAAVNARFRVDGYPPAGWLESADNTVENVVEGVTLTLKATSDGDEVAVTVARDTDAVVAQIQSFVDSYNALVGQINTFTSFDSTSNTLGILLGDSGVNQLERELASLVTRPLTGLDPDNEYSILSQVGLKTGGGGQITLDAEALREALDAHPDDVAELFTFSSRTSDSVLSFFTRTATSPAGEPVVEASWDAAGTLLSATVDGEAATIEGNLITADPDGSWAGLRFLFRDPGSGAGSRSAVIGLSHGIAAALTRTLTRLTDETNGLVQFQTGRLETTVERLDQDIEDMEARLVIKREMLEQQFIAMETAISRLQGQAVSLNSLSSNSNSAS
jgi:flagellar hook-associated protein 2